MNIVQQLEQEQMERLSGERPIPEFAPGDTLRVDVKVIEGTRERVQAFEGVCIARRNAGINSSFTVRKISYNEGVERVFPLYSPRLAGITVVRRGDVRRAKLYYLRGRTGRAARIREKTTGYSAKVEAQVRAEAQEAAKVAREVAAEKKAAAQAAKAAEAEAAANAKAAEAPAEE